MDNNDENSGQPLTSTGAFVAPTTVNKPGVESPRTNVGFVVAQLKDCADDPMWADHAEVSKRLLNAALKAIAQLQRDNAILAQEIVDAADPVLEITDGWRAEKLKALRKRCSPDGAQE